MDGAYDGAPTTDAIRSARPSNSSPKIIVPPRKDSIPPLDQPHSGSERELHAAEIAKHGRMAGQKRHDYGMRSLAETTVLRVKKLNDGKLNSRTFGAQQNEVAIQIAALKKMIRAAKPNTIKVS